MKKKSLINIKDSINLKLFITSEKKKSLKEMFMIFGVSLGALAIIIPSCGYLFHAPDSFVAFIKDIFGLVLALGGLVAVMIIGLCIFEGIPQELGENKGYSSPIDHFFKDGQAINESINHYDNWHALLLTLHLVDEKHIEFSKIKEVEASMKFNQEILSQLNVEDLTDEIKKEVNDEQHKILNQMKLSLQYIINHKLLKNENFLNLLDRTTINEKLFKIKEKQENYLKKHELAIHVRQIAHQKREEILNQKEEMLVVENEIKEVKEKLKALAL